MILELRLGGKWVASRKPLSTMKMVADKLIRIIYFAIRLSPDRRQMCHHIIVWTRSLPISIWIYMVHILLLGWDIVAAPSSLFIFFQLQFHSAVPPNYGLVWYSTSILGSWNFHLLRGMFSPCLSIFGWPSSLKRKNIYHMIIAM